MLELDVNEIGVIIYNLHRQKEKIEESLRFGTQMVERGDKTFKGFVRTQKRDLKELSKLLDQYEAFRKKFTNQE